MDVTYLFDPLCGWCYGASAALDHLAAQPDVTLTLAPTGLFAGDRALVMDAQFAAFAWQNDQRIRRLTGQDFSDAYREQVLGQTGGRVDSAPATLALVAVGMTAPGGEWTALKALQRARYVAGRNNSEFSVVIEVLQATGFDAAAARLQTPDAELHGAYQARIATARGDMAQFGVDGVPALIVGNGANRQLLRSGALFGDSQQLTETLRRVA